MISLGSERVLVRGTQPRAFTTDVSWLVWIDSGLHVAPLDTMSELPIAGAPAGAPDAFDVAGPYIFGVWGTRLWAITCP